MLQVRDAKVKDLPALLEIYNDAIINSTATFDLEKQTMEQRKPWFESHGGKFPLIVADDDGEIVGYCSLSPFKDKEAYERTVELSVYISPNHSGKGAGTTLVQEMLKRAEDLKYHSIISVITSGNDVSVHLHEKFGFKLVGVLKEVGFKFNQWQDVYYYQLILG